ncbi:hypothetical protein BUALT_Bualt09G0036200 [Buddleja alternifolia]|uniref:DDE Tnp4 domain-containing protein n=1 Tax=Buddleja alternifolia TaxID=168488 RepID=A0AAV6XAK5_9LAMI|nr:hypothetical protein BUALT_Bualt09G0036200 [Buddleja alternifolia]
MEISSFPFSEDYSSFFQDSEPLTFSNFNKRPRTDNFFDFEHDDSSIQELLSELLALDSPPEVKHAHNVPSVFPTSINYIKVNSEMNYTSYADSGNLSNTKRARAEADDESPSVASGGVAHRRLWVKDRSKAWWEQVNSPDYPEDEFKKAFQMSKATFDMICEELESVVTKKDTMLRLAIPVRQRVAVCIWRLATGEALREVSKRFGLGISTCHKLILEVCTAIKNVLMPKFLQWPDEHRTMEIKTEFEFLSGIPNVCGSMYTTHIPIVAPKSNVAAYFNKRHTERNQKSSYSVTVQGVVDSKGVFTDICIGWPGSMSNDQILEKSALFQRANQGTLNDMWVVGDSGFPLMDWLLVPYTQQNLTWTKHAFNEKTKDVQRVAKETFMRMKGRWRCLQKRTEMKLQDLPVVLGACCVLHNICEMRDEGLREEMSFEVFDDEIVPENSVRSVNAMSVRDQIAHKLLHHAGNNSL